MAAPNIKNMPTAVISRGFGDPGVSGKKQYSFATWKCREFIRTVEAGYRPVSDNLWLRRWYPCAATARHWVQLARS